MPTCRALPHYCQRAPRQHVSGTLGYCGASPVPFPHCQHCPRRPGARPRAEPRLGVALPAPPGPTAIASAPALRGAAPGTPTSTAALGLSDGRVTGQGGASLHPHSPPPGLRQDHGPAGARGLGGRPGSGTRGPCTHLPGLQLEPQAQLRVVNGTVVPELCQRQPEVRQGLLEPVGVGAGGGPQRPREGPPAPAFFLPPPQLRGQLPGQQWSPRSQHEVGTQVQTKGSRGQHAEVAAS